MDKFIIDGPVSLKGRVKISGGKNAALPQLLATLLTDEKCILRRVPDLRDIRTTFKILEHLGKNVEYKNGIATITTVGELKTSVPYDLVKQMRASFWVAGPILARLKKAQIPLPGGCAIGVRPVDIHLKGFEKLGAAHHTEKGDIVITADKLKGAKIVFRFPSVGATQNLLMAAALVEGDTTLENYAKEPEIYDIIDMLNDMGADITEKKDKIIIKGKPTLGGVDHTVVADRIEAGTYMIAAALTKGDVTVENCVPEHNEFLIETLKESGATVEVNGNSVRVCCVNQLKPVSIKTLPYPGFATDLQAPYMALLCVADGPSTVEEDIFENRFMHAAELTRMGADIRIEKSIARVYGVKQLSGANVMSSDLRGGAALVLAALAGEGQSTVERIYHIDRGYENFEGKLTALGAKIKRING